MYRGVKSGFRREVAESWEILGYYEASTGNSVPTFRNLVNPILYADDQILMATSEDDLQTMTYHLKLTARKYKITKSSTNTKAMAMWGNHIQRVKMVINDKIIEQVTDFKYMVYRVSEYKGDLEDKLRTYNKINGAIRRHFGKQITKKQS